MSKIDKVNDGELDIGDANIDTGIQDEGTFNIEKEVLPWNDLNEMHRDIAKTIIEQQYLVLELYNANKEVVDSDKITKAKLEGLTLSIQNFSKDIVDLKNQFSDRTGNAENIDDRMDYLSIATAYVSVNEKLANIMSTSYLDIFTKLSVNATDMSKLKDTVTDGKKSVDEVLNGK